MVSDADDLEAELKPRLERIYNAYRTTFLNVKYYGYKLHRVNQYKLTVEIMVVIGSAASGVSGWAIWKWNLQLENAWLLIAATSTLLAALNPVLQVNKKIEKYSKLFGGHNSNFLHLDDLIGRIRAQRQLTRSLEIEFSGTQKRHQELSAEDVPYASRRLTKRFQKEVNRAIPTSALWYPRVNI